MPWRDASAIPAEQAPPDGEAIVSADGIELCYQSLGDHGAPVILLIMGLGIQVIKGMGHDLLPGAQALLLEGIVSHYRGAARA